MPRRILVLPAVLAIAMVALCSSASAHLVEVGSPLDADFNGQYCTVPTGTWTNEALGEEGAHAASPVDGAVVGWAMEGDYSEGEPFELRILRPAGGGAYTGVGTSAQVRPQGEFLGTRASFHTDLPIKKGDLIGINLNSDCVGVAAVTGSHLGNWFPALGEGSTLIAPYPHSDQEIGVQAVVQPAPTATSVSPTTSGLGGGGVVTIQGTDLEEASGVSFGGVPSPSFSVESERQITAVVPPGATPGAVPVTVTTIAGTATAPQQLAYQACVVPAMKGKPATAAKNAVAAAGCALGKITHRAAPKPKGKKKRKKAKPKVVAQSRPAGATLPFGAKVDLTVKG